jgi:RHS repeat-associated protein
MINLNWIDHIHTTIGYKLIVISHLNVFHRKRTNHLGNVLATVSDRKIGVSLDSSRISSYTPVINSAQEYYPFGMLMPGRGGHIGTGKNVAGSTVVMNGDTIPATLTVTQRSNNTPGTYMATQTISFEGEFSSGTADEFTTLFVDQTSADPGTESGISYGVAAKGYRYGFNGKENDNEVKGEGKEQDYGMRMYDPGLGKFLSVDPLTKKFAHYSPYQFSGNTPIQAIDLDGTEDVHYIFIWLKAASGKETVLKVTGWIEGKETGKVDEHGRSEYDRPYRIIGHYPARAFGQTIFVNAAYNSEADFSRAKASDFYSSAILEGSGKGAEIANDFGFALSMGYFGASLGNLSKQLITEYVEAKTAQYVNSVAEKSVLNHLVEENIQKTFQTAGVNANVVAHGTLTYEPIAGGMVGHTVPWSVMTQAERRAFQHSYTRHSAELGLPNWAQSRASELQGLFNNAVTNIRAAGEGGFFRSSELVNGVKTIVNRTQPIIDGQQYFYYETIGGKFISAGTMP